MLCTLLITSVLSGCQVVSVKEQALNVTLSNERDSILTRDKLSEASLNVLSMTGREAQICIDQPQECIEDLKKIPQILDEQLLSTASELYLANSLQRGKSAECNASLLTKTQSEEKQQLQKQNIQKCLDQQLNMLDKSIRYSYAYLFKTERAPQDRIFDNRQVQIRDFYNLAIAHLIQRYAERYESKQSGQRIQVGDSVYTIDLENFPQLKNQPIEQLVSTYNMNFSGLRSITRRDGFGSEFLVVLPEKQVAEQDKKYIVNPLKHQYPNGINPNIHSARYLATTITAVPKAAASTEQILSTSEFHLKLYDPYKYEKIKLASKDYALAANFSAPYGLWLAENNLGRLAYLTLINRDDNSLSMPHLYMLEPYNPNKKVLVLVHGLASSPEAWIRLTNDIMGDPVLRENFQVWQVFYSTNMPILESRFQINALVQQSFARVANNAPAKKDAVLVGHSMGGVIARLMVSQADITQDAFKLVQNTRIEKFKDNPLFKARLQMQPIPNFSRAIFLATPHRGTEYADRWHTKLARKIIQIPGAFLGAFADTLQGEIGLSEFVKELGHDLIQNGPSDLSENSKFTALTQNIQPSKNIKFHSIIGNTVDTTDPKLMSDDIVSYQSAYLDGAVSSKVIKGGHSIQETPEAVLELRRILRLHLADLGLYDPK